LLINTVIIQRLRVLRNTSITQIRTTAALLQYNNTAAKGAFKARDLSQLRGFIPTRTLFLTIIARR
jgi:hypothetical protein